jgi:hypothetical protein
MANKCQQANGASSTDGLQTEPPPSEVIARHYENQNKVREELIKCFTSRLLMYTELLGDVWRLGFKENVAAISSLFRSGLLDEKTLDCENRSPVVRNNPTRSLANSQWTDRLRDFRGTDTVPSPATLMVSLLKMSKISSSMDKYHRRYSLPLLRGRELLEVLSINRNEWKEVCTFHAITERVSR